MSRNGGRGLQDFVRNDEIRRLVAEGLTQRQVAARFGITYQRVSQIVVGQRRKGEPVPKEHTRVCRWCDRTFTVDREHRYYCCEEHAKRAMKPLYTRQQFEEELAAEEQP